jgi:hypothetical protein
LRGKRVGDETQFGIIRKAALYAGHGPATIRQFRDLWCKKGFTPLPEPAPTPRPPTPILARPKKQPSLFD